MNWQHLVPASCCYRSSMEIVLFVFFALFSFDILPFIQYWMLCTSILGPFKTTHNHQNITPTVFGCSCYLLSQRSKELRLTAITSFFINRRACWMGYALFLWRATNHMYVCINLYICVYILLVYELDTLANKNSSLWCFIPHVDWHSLYNLQQKSGISWLMPSSVSTKSIINAWRKEITVLFIWFVIRTIIYI